MKVKSVLQEANVINTEVKVKAYEENKLIEI